LLAVAGVIGTRLQAQLLVLLADRAAAAHILLLLALEHLDREMQAELDLAQ
jgi:hypothetical protein